MVQVILNANFVMCFSFSGRLSVRQVSGYCGSKSNVTEIRAVFAEIGSMILIFSLRSSQESESEIIRIAMQRSR